MFLLLGGCTRQTELTEEEAEYMALVDLERVNQTVSIPEDTMFLTMDAEEKQSIYEELDKIGTYEDSPKATPEYSNLELIQTEQEYHDIVARTAAEPAILYLGFEDCPWCKAFNPKINHFAREAGITIYYYDTDLRENDESFDNVIDSYEVNTVPFAFIVDDGTVKERINHHSSMQQIENFVTLYKENYLK